MQSWDDHLDRSLTSPLLQILYPNSGSYAEVFLIPWLKVPTSSSSSHLPPPLSHRDSIVTCSSSTGEELSLYLSFFFFSFPPFLIKTGCITQRTSCKPHFSRRARVACQTIVCQSNECSSVYFLWCCHRCRAYSCYVCCIFSSPFLVFIVIILLLQCVPSAPVCKGNTCSTLNLCLSTFEPALLASRHCMHVRPSLRGFTRRHTYIHVPRVMTHARLEGEGHGNCASQRTGMAPVAVTA